MENDWTLSFNPGTPRDLTAQQIVADMAPFLTSATFETHERFELVLDSDLPDGVSPQDRLWEVMCRLQELYPNGLVVGHLEDESRH